MIVKDTNSINYILGTDLLMEGKKPDWEHWRAVRRDQLIEALSTRGAVKPYYFSEFFNSYMTLSSPEWPVKLSFFGRLHIGCRTFNRKNTKLILEWAKEAA